MAANGSGVLETIDTQVLEFIRLEIAVYDHVMPANKVRAISKRSSDVKRGVVTKLYQTLARRI